MDRPEGRTRSGSPAGRNESCMSISAQDPRALGYGRLHAASRVFFDLGGTLFSYASINSHFDGVLESLARGRGVTAPAEDLRRLSHRDDAHDGRMGVAALLPAPRPVHGSPPPVPTQLRRRSERRGPRPAFLGGPRARRARDHAPRRCRRDARRPARARPARPDRLEHRQRPARRRVAAPRTRRARPRHHHQRRRRSCKPHPGIFQVALEKAGNPPPSPSSSWATRSGTTSRAPTRSA